MSWSGKQPWNWTRQKSKEDGHRFPEGKITSRPAADQWFADRNRRQLQVSVYSHLLWAWLGGEAWPLHSEEGIAEKCTFSGSWRSLAWPTAWDPRTVLQGRRSERAVLLASSLVSRHHTAPEETSEPCNQEKLAPHSTGRDVWTVSSGKPAPHITRRDVWTVSSGMPASHSTRRDVWTVSSGMPAGEIVGCELLFFWRCSSNGLSPDPDGSLQTDPTQCMTCFRFCRLAEGIYQLLERQLFHQAVDAFNRVVGCLNTVRVCVGAIKKEKKKVLLLLMQQQS